MEAKERSKMPFPEPSNTTETEIAFVEMPNAVQSEIAFLNTASLDKNSKDYFPALLANQILGGGGEAKIISESERGQRVYLWCLFRS